MNRIRPLTAVWLTNTNEADVRALLHHSVECVLCHTTRENLPKLALEGGVLFDKKNVIILACRQLSFEGRPRAFYPGVIPRISVRYGRGDLRFGVKISNDDSAAKQIKVNPVVKASYHLRIAGEHEKDTDFG